MATSKVHQVQDLTVDDRHTIERLLGRPLKEEETVEVTAPSRPYVIKPAPVGVERERAFAALLRTMREISSQAAGVPEEEINALVDEAIIEVRRAGR